MRHTFGGGSNGIYYCRNCGLVTARPSDPRPCVADSDDSDGYPDESVNVITPRASA